MVEIIKDVPSYVAAFKVSSAVTAEDFDSVILPIIDEKVKRFGRIHFLLYLNTNITNFTAGAALRDIWVGIKHLTKWHRMAIVTDQPVVEKFTDIVSLIAPGEAKGFPVSELPFAKLWVAE